MAGLVFPPGTDPEKIGEVKPEDVKKVIVVEDLKGFFNAAFSSADEARRSREVVWKKAYDLYNGIYDWSGKAPWQSQVNIPKVRQTVDRAAATFKRALVRMKRFYGIESETKAGIEKGLFTILLMDYWLDQAKFVNEFTTGLKSGLITSTMVYKIWWEWAIEKELALVPRVVRERERLLGMPLGGMREMVVNEVQRGNKKVGRLGFKAVDPFKFWIVPGTNGSGMIEKTEMNVADLEDLARRGIYDKEAVKEIVEGGRPREPEEDEEQKRKGELPSRKNTYIRTVDIYHFWGDIYNELGQVVQRNATFTIGNKDVVLRKPRENPFFHGKPPYVVGTPYVVPFSTYNRGIVEDVMGIATMITELSNLIIDGAMFDAMKAFELDVSQLYDMGEAKSGVYPGKVFRKRGDESLSGKKLIEAVDVGRIPSDVGQVISFLDRELQVQTAVTELISGAPSTGSRTATEVSAKQSQALEGLDDAARTVEETIINPSLEMIAKISYQFHNDFSMPRLAENFPETASALGSMSPEERYIVMVDGFQFQARGISIMLDKAQSLGKLTEFFNLISNIPGIVERINVDNLLEEIIIALGLNPRKVLLNPNAQMVQPVAAGPGVGQFPDIDTARVTPAQARAGELGARMGGSTNNPRALPTTQMNIGGNREMLAQMLAQ